MGLSEIWANHLRNQQQRSFLRANFSNPDVKMSIGNRLKGAALQKLHTSPLGTLSRFAEGGGLKQLAIDKIAGRGSLGQALSASLNHQQTRIEQTLDKSEFLFRTILPKLDHLEYRVTSIENSLVQNSLRDSTLNATIAALVKEVEEQKKNKGNSSSWIDVFAKSKLLFPSLLAGAGAAAAAATAVGIAGTAALAVGVKLEADKAQDLIDVYEAYKKNPTAANKAAWEKKFDDDGPLIYRLIKKGVGMLPKLSSSSPYSNLPMKKAGMPGTSAAQRVEPEEDDQSISAKGDLMIEAKGDILIDARQYLNLKSKHICLTADKITIDTPNLVLKTGQTTTQRYSSSDASGTTRPTGGKSYLGGPSSTGGLRGGDPSSSSSYTPPSLTGRPGPGPGAPSQRHEIAPGLSPSLPYLPGTSQRTPGTTPEPIAPSTPGVPRFGPDFSGFLTPSTGQDGSVTRYERKGFPGDSSGPSQFPFTQPQMPGVTVQGSPSSGQYVAGQMQVRGGNVDPKELYASAAAAIAKSSLNGYVPQDGAKWGIKTGSPEEWARMLVGVAQQESSLKANPPPSDNGRSAGLFQFGASDLRNYGVRTGVEDPHGQLQAAVNQMSKYIVGSKDKPGAGVISGYGNGPGSYDGRLGASAYFGSMIGDPTQRGTRAYNEAAKYLRAGQSGEAWVDRQIAGVQLNKALPGQDQFGIKSISESPALMEQGKIAEGAGVAQRLPDSSVDTNQAIGLLGLMNQKPDAGMFAKTNEPTREFKNTGTITVNGNQYQYVSGGSGKGGAPFGQHEVDSYKSYTKGDTVPEGVVLSDHSPAMNRTGRSEIMVHPMYGRVTAGCFGIKPKDYQNFKRDFLIEKGKADAEGRKLTMNVGPDAGAVISGDKVAGPGAPNKMPADIPKSEGFKAIGQSENEPYANPKYSASPSRREYELFDRQKKQNEDNDPDFDPVKAKENDDYNRETGNQGYFAGDKSSPPSAEFLLWKMKKDAAVGKQTSLTTEEQRVLENYKNKLTEIDSFAGKTPVLKQAAIDPKMLEPPQQIFQDAKQDTRDTTVGDSGDNSGGGGNNNNNPVAGPDGTKNLSNVSHDQEKISNPGPSDWEGAKMDYLNGEGSF